VETRNNSPPPRRLTHRAVSQSAILVILSLIATVVWLAARRLRVPYTVALVVAGLVLGSTHVFPAPALTRNVMFGLVLPALIFEAAFDLELEEVRRDGVTLASLAVPGVIAAIGATVLAFPPLLSLLGVVGAGGSTQTVALVFAALMSTTDPVAVVALFRALDAPRRLQVIVEGESLLNDATAIIFLTLAVESVGQTATAFVVGDFFYVIGAAVIVGGVVGVAASAIIRRLSEPTLELLLTTIAAYGSFAGAEAIHASGVIATVAAGLMCGSRAGRSVMSATARIATATFWDYLAFVLNSFVFLSVGLMVRIPTLIGSWRAIVTAYAVVTASRVVVTTGISALLPDRLRLPNRWTAILSWGGLRGALSIVLALSLPEAFPARELLVTMTFGVVVLSIFVQGVTVGPALRWLGLTRPGIRHLGYEDTRGALLSAHSSLGDVEKTGGMVATDEHMYRALTVEYAESLDRAQRDLAVLSTQIAGNGSGGGAREFLATRERRRVAAAFEAGAIDAEQRDRRLADLEAHRWDGDGDGGAGH